MYFTPKPPFMFFLGIIKLMMLLLQSRKYNTATHMNNILLYIYDALAMSASVDDKQVTDGRRNRTDKNDGHENETD